MGSRRHLEGGRGELGDGDGIGRIVDTTEQAREFREGEILVTTSPNPAWTPLFAMAAGMIASTGSMLSHGLVSAREYHLPAVIGIPNVTAKIQNGQKVTLDGSTGIVSLIRA